MVSGGDITLTTSGSSGCYGFIDLSRSHSSVRAGLQEDQPVLVTVGGFR